MKDHQYQDQIEKLLWQQWFIAPNTTVREDIFNFYKKWAASQAKKLFYNGAFPMIDCEDYEQYAYIGLLEAIDNYVEQGSHFKPYAALRVRGAVLNAVYKFSELASLYKKRSSLSNEYINSYIKEHSASKEDSASGVILEISLEYFLQQAPSSETTTEHFSLFNSEEMDVMHNEVEAAKRTLAKLEQTILELYYQHGLSYQQIAEHLDVTKGRIGQIHKGIMTKLKKQLSW